MLLRFRVANHRSIRDEQTFSFVAVPRRGHPKPTGPIPPTVKVAGIYGANASGKSNILAALHWMTSAIRDSATRWQPTAPIPRDPFLLADDTPPTSFYELDFVHEGVRYSYGFEVSDTAVTGEWLHSFPVGRSRVLFERDSADAYKFGRALTGETAAIARLTRTNGLYLSTAASAAHPLLGDLYETLTERIRFARQDHLDEQTRLHATTTILRWLDTAELDRYGDDTARRLRRFRHEMDRLLCLADIGVTGMEILAYDQEKGEDRIALLRAGTSQRLTLDQESAGTRVWLSMILSTLEVLLRDGVLVVDEIDSSLHPTLSSTLIRMFKDPAINPNDTQLLFASHDTTLLGSMLDDDLLDRDEVWFSEKDSTGATALFSLADFHPRADENVERGYLQGRYGAVPYVNFNKVREVFSERHTA
jgi:hypothetical protein